MPNTEFEFIAAVIEEKTVRAPTALEQDGSGMGGSFTVVYLNDDVMVDQNGVRVDSTVSVATGQRPPGADNFTYAAFRGDIGALKKLLREHGPDLVHATNINGITALMWAATKGHVEVAEFLLQNGADMNREDPDGNNSIDRARIDYRREMVEFLSQWTPPAVQELKIKEEFQQQAARVVDSVEKKYYELEREKTEERF